MSRDEMENSIEHLQFTPSLHLTDEAQRARRCSFWHALDCAYNTSRTSPLHHDNRCMEHGTRQSPDTSPKEMP